MKKYRLFLAAFAAILLALTGCSGGNEVTTYDDTAGDAEVKLSFFGNKYEPANVEVIEDILTGYMEENPGTAVSYESLKGSGYYDALTNRESSGKLDDVFMSNHDTVLAFSQNNSLADLTDLAEDVPFSEIMQDQMRSSDGRIYWVPTTVSAFGLYCNLDLLKQHKQEVPKTLAEWESVCDYFVSQNITPIIANNDISLKTLALAKGFYPLYQKGTQAEAFEQLNSGKKPLSAYLREGFALAEEFCKKGYINAGEALNTEKTSDDLEAFVKGESPFMLTGAWAAGRVKGMEPDFKFEVVAYPILEDGSVLVINPDVRLCVSAKGENTEAAKDFVSYFLKTDNIRKFADNQCSFLPLKGEYEPSLAEIQDLVKLYESQPSVIGSDSYARFPIWDITADVSKKLLAGEKLNDIMKWMDKQVTADF